MLLEMLHARDRLLDARPVSDRHPPQNDGRPFKMLEPIGASAIEALVDGLPDKALKCMNALPNRKIDDDARVGIGPRIRGVAALVDVAPDEAGAALGNAVHRCQVVGELRHARIVDRVSNAADVQLCKMMVGWLLQGPAPARRLIGLPKRERKISRRIDPEQGGAGAGQDSVYWPDAQIRIRRDEASDAGVERTFLTAAMDSHSLKRWG